MKPTQLYASAALVAAFFCPAHAQVPVVAAAPCTAASGGGYSCPLTVTVPPAPVVSTPDAPTAQPVYVPIAAEGGKFTLLEPQKVRYGAGSAWTEKAILAGVETACSNDVFGDPVYGVVKRCEVKGGPALEVQPVPTAPMPPVVDHSQMGPHVDAAKLAAIPARRGTTSQMISTNWYDNVAGGPCAPSSSPNCKVNPYAHEDPSDLGAVRMGTGFVKFGYFDPIVFPGADNASHLHTFANNADISPTTTPASLLGCNSVGAGGSANCSAYWMPSVIDTRSGAPQVPSGVLIYYKCSYQFDICSANALYRVEPFPTGLRMVSGDAKNTDPAKASGSFSCLNPTGEGATASLFNDLAKSGACTAGRTLRVSIGFPYCWDGINLDSPNHAAHMSKDFETFVGKLDPTGKFVVPGDQGAPGTFYAQRCPATHPHALPALSFNFDYLITDDQMVANLRLASDAEGAPAGVSAHADEMMGWDPAIMKRWVDGCLRRNYGCVVNLLGDGYKLDDPAVTTASP